MISNIHTYWSSCLGPITEMQVLWQTALCNLFMSNPVLKNYAVKNSDNISLLINIVNEH